MSRNFSRDETEWGCFGDTWGATLTASAGGSAATSALFNAPKSVAAAPAAVTAKANVAALPLTTSKVSLAGLTSRAPQTALSTALAQVTPKTPLVSKSLSAPTSALVTSVKLAPPPAPKAPSTPAGSLGPSAAQSANFLDGGAPLTAPQVKPAAQKLTDLLVGVANQAKGQPAAIAKQNAAAAALTSTVNARGYASERAQADQASLQQNQAISKLPIMHQGEGAWNFAGLDYGLIPKGAEVLAIGAAGVATAGVAVPAIAGAGVSAATLGSLVSADGIVAAASKAGGSKAKAVIDTTKSLAAGGNVDAQKGLTVLAAVTADRALKGVPDGVTQTAASLLPLTTNSIIQDATQGGGLVVRPDPGVNFLTADQLASVAPQQPFISTAKAPDFRLAADTPQMTEAQLAEAADHRLRWTVLETGKLYRGAAPKGAGNQYQVFDSGPRCPGEHVKLAVG